MSQQNEIEVVEIGEDGDQYILFYDDPSKEKDLDEKTARLRLAGFLNNTFASYAWDLQDLHDTIDFALTAKATLGWWAFVTPRNGDQLLVRLDKEPEGEMGIFGFYGAFIGRTILPSTEEEVAAHVGT